KGVRVVTAGAPPAAATIERIEGELGWSITHVYGLTETSPFITVCEPRPEHDALSPAERAAVKARQGVELLTSGDLRVVDEDGRDVPRDGTTVGEIVVRGNAVMKGYYNDPEATAQALRGGYFHTGDAAVVHADGYIDIRDRLKDVIISGGENISSVEVEGVLLRHPAVQEVAIVGFPNEQWGEAPHAFVVLHEGARTDERELCEFARANLAHFKAPHSVTFVNELPKTATGKIQRSTLLLLAVAFLVAWRADDQPPNVSMALALAFIFSNDAFLMLLEKLRVNAAIRAPVAVLTFILGAGFYIRAAQLFPRTLTP